MKRLVPLACLAVWLGGLAAQAQPITDTFNIVVDRSNNVREATGTGWNNSWVGEYNDAPDRDWRNMWFYDHPPLPGGKLIDLSFTITPSTGWQNGFVAVALNWSNPDFPETGPDGPPPMPEQEQYIERYEVFAGAVGASTPIQVPTYEIPDFNPEWVSIDVFADGPQGVAGPAVRIEGTLVHECLAADVIPEPATLGLLALGGLGLLRRRRRT